SWATPAVERLIAPRPRVDKAKCIGCEKCREICPQQVITMEKGRAHIDQKGCIKCFCCHEMCPVKAIEIKRFILFK
ncbi:MAG: 4Fe-4S binding protein, partial [Oscillospiraceae bacterium]